MEDVAIPSQKMRDVGTQKCMVGRVVGQLLIRCRRFQIILIGFIYDEVLEHFVLSDLAVLHDPTQGAIRHPVVRVDFIEEALPLGALVGIRIQNH